MNILCETPFRFRVRVLIRISVRVRIIVRVTVKIWVTLGLGLASGLRFKLTQRCKSFIIIVNLDKIKNLLRW